LNPRPEDARKRRRNKKIAVVLAAVALVGAGLWFEAYTSTIYGCFCGGSAAVSDARFM
jgi:ferric-dicitrate binding protein FerR (iron transport regulator)